MRRPITALDVLATIAHQDAFEALVEEHTTKCLTQWREKDYPDKDDEHIYGEKLKLCGWRYNFRQRRWYFPDAPALAAPRSLEELARLITREALKQVLKKRS